MEKKTIVLITNLFPYSKDSETFLETEIRYWAKQHTINLIVMPMHFSEYIRNIPENILVDSSFSKYLAVKEKDINSKWNKILYMLKALGEDIFWKEIRLDIIKRPSLIKELLLSLRKYEIYKEFFKQYTKENSIELFYTYWNTEVTYSLQSLGVKLNHNTVTRVHGFDLYKERTFKNYMPLRKQFTKNIKQVYALSEKSVDYMIETYGYERVVIQISRLGVLSQQIITRPSSKNDFHMVSCSNLISIKRVDKIIDVVSFLAKKNMHLTIKWTHIGDGEEYEKLLNYAREKLINSNINYSFFGFLSNTEIFELYRKEEIDVFINLSESEGVPVSIMEAMSCHIPIVALNIGGISDMVISNFNGMLFPEDKTALEIANMLNNTLYFKDKIIRENSYSQYIKYYDSNHNYKNFIKTIETIVFSENKNLDILLKENK